MANSGERVTGVACTVDKLIVDLAAGRSISVPFSWYPRLLHPLPLGIVTIGTFLALALASTGQNLMKISVCRAFFVEPYHHS